MGKQFKIGSSVVMHVGTNRVTAKIIVIRWRKRKSDDGQEIVEYPTDLKSGDDAEILFEAHKPMPIFKLEENDNEKLTKIIGLERKRVVLYGKICNSSFDYPIEEILVRGYVRTDVEK